MTPLELDSGSTAWILTSASLVLLMTPGLALFYGGMVRAKSVLNMMMMSFGALALISVLWVLYGYSMAFGNDIGAGLLGDPTEYFGLRGLMTDDPEATYPAMAFVGFQAVVAIITVALISGAIADRAKFGAWVIFVPIWVTLVYCPLAFMVWGGGLLSEEGAVGMAVGEAIDFAGGTVVHISAGVAALVLALILGKRQGFGKDPAQRPHNIPFVMLGAALLWFGWFGFNGGAAGSAEEAGLIWVNTMVAPAAAMIGWLMLERIRDGRPTSLGAASGIVAGLVAITPACANVSPIGAVCLGVVAGALCSLAVGLKYRLGFDDSLDVVAVHLVAGIIGTIAPGFIALPVEGEGGGLFYGGGPDQLIAQIVAAAIAIVLSAVMTAIIGLAIHKTIGFRITPDDEVSGVDLSEHAETAYEFGGLGVGGSFHPFAEQMMSQKKPSQHAAEKPQKTVSEDVHS